MTIVVGSQFWVGFGAGCLVGTVYALLVVVLLALVFRRNPFNGTYPKTGGEQAWVLKEQDRS